MFISFFRRIANRNIVGIAILIDPKQQIDIVFLGPPNRRPLPKQQPQRNKVQQPIPINLPPLRLRHVLQCILTVFANQIFDPVQQLQSFGVLDRPLRQHYVLVPLFQTGLVLVVLRLVLLYKLLQEYF